MNRNYDLSIYTINDYAGNSYFVCTKCEHTFTHENELIKHLEQNNCIKLSDDTWFGNWLNDFLFNIINTSNACKNEIIDDLNMSIDDGARQLIKHLVANTDNLNQNNKQYIKNILQPIINKYKLSIIKNERLVSA